MRSKVDYIPIYCDIVAILNIDITFATLSSISVVHWELVPVLAALYTYTVFFLKNSSHTFSVCVCTSICK